MSSKDAEKLQIIIFKLDEKLYGVHIDQIREITRVGEVTPVPGAPPYVEGVTNLRGQVTTVIDLRKRLGMAPKNLDKQSRMMIIESPGNSEGVIVDSIVEVTMLPKANIEEPPEIAKTSKGRSSYITGIGKKDGKLIILIDLQKLISAELLTETHAITPLVSVEAVNNP